jgi:PEP-CTERM motif
MRTAGAIRQTFHAGLMSALMLGTLVAFQPVAAAPILTGPVTVTEHEPPFPDLVNTVTTVVSGGTAEITSGDGTDIGGLLLDGEFIDINSVFGTNTILFSIRGTGNSNAGGHPAGFFDTGYTSTAQYLFTGFHFSSAAHISGVSASTPDADVSDLGTLNLAFTNDSITMNFGGLGVRGSSTNLGELLLSVQTVADTTPPGMPEPASLALVGIGLAAAAWRNRRK